MEAIIKNTGEHISVEQKIVYVDEMTSYFVYENKETHKTYNYKELIFI